MEPNALCLWAAQSRDAVQNLRALVRQTKRHRAACCHLYAAAIAAQLALEQSVHSNLSSTSLAEQQQKICASITAAIELAQQRVQVIQYTHIRMNAACVHAQNKTPHSAYYAAV